MIPTIYNVEVVAVLRRIVNALLWAIIAIVVAMCLTVTILGIVSPETVRPLPFLD